MPENDRRARLTARRRARRTAGSAETRSQDRRSRLTLPDRISIADGPLRTSPPGQWRLFLTATPPAACWRAALLRLAALTPAAQKLQLSFDRRALVFRCDGREHEMLDAICEINRLIEETNQRSGRPESQTTEDVGW
jgi:hypothetical protein